MGPSRYQLSKPLIVAVAGYAVAGGLELSLMGDIRIAEESAIFGVFCRRVGVPLIGTIFNDINVISIVILLIFNRC